MSNRILVTQPIDADGCALLEAAGFTLDIWPGPEPIPHGELVERVRGCVGLLSMLTDQIDEAVLDAGDLRVIAQHAVGINNIDLQAVHDRGIGLAHTPGVLTNATARRRISGTTPWAASRSPTAAPHRKRPCATPAAEPGTSVALAAVPTPVRTRSQETASLKPAQKCA